MISKIMLHLIIRYHHMQYEFQATNNHPIRVYLIVLRLGDKMSCSIQSIK